MNNTIPVITIDGPSGVGKGTIIKELSKLLPRWHILDSGKLYRILAYSEIDKFLDISSLSRLQIMEFIDNLNIIFSVEGDIILNDLNVSDKINNENIANHASRLAENSLVRDCLIDIQRDFLKEPGLLADGRDMGTVIFTNATLKIYLEANVEIRAKRRYKQLQGQNKNVSLLQIEKTISERDMRDKNRESAPLIPADDALVIDTSYISVTEVFELITPHLISVDIKCG